MNVLLNYKRNGFFSKRDSQSINFCFELFIPKEGFFWFIEKTETQEWLTGEMDGDEWLLTKDPLKAKRFGNQMAAMGYCHIHKLRSETYTQTEHEFVD